MVSNLLTGKGRQNRESEAPFRAQLAESFYCAFRFWRRE
jgi:hypothetical protein